MWQNFFSGHKPQWVIGVLGVMSHTDWMDWLRGLTQASHIWRHVWQIRTELLDPRNYLTTALILPILNPYRAELGSM